MRETPQPLWHHQYETFRSPEWNISGTPNCWVVYSEIVGLNGLGGYWIKEHWTWRSGGTHHVQPRSLSWDESRELDEKIAAHLLIAEASK